MLAGYAPQLAKKWRKTSGFVMPGAGNGQGARIQAEIARIGILSLEVKKFCTERWFGDQIGWS